MSFITGMKNKITGVFSSAGSWLLNAGKNIIKGFLNGITSMFSSVKNKLSSLTSYLPKWKGPEDTDKKILIPAGKFVIGGFKEAMEASYPAVRQSLQGFTKTLAPTVDAGLKVNGLTDLKKATTPLQTDVRSGRPSFSGTISGGGPNRQANLPAPTVNITNNYPVAKPDSAMRDEVAQGIRLAAIV